MKLKTLLITTLAVFGLSMAPALANDTIYINDENMSSIEDIHFSIENALPNDTFSKLIDVENKSDKKVELYLKSENKEMNELIQTIDVKIAYNQKLICNDKMSEVLNVPIRLNSIDPDEKIQISIECHIPAELDNQFNMTSTQLDYVLFGEYENKAVKTEDNIVADYLLITAFLSGLGIAIFAYKHYEEVKKDEEI